jgi:4-hydroxy-3-polyprenylbenzoate decarboxylase
MPYRNLADFLEDLGRAGDLAPVDAEVDPCLEVAEVTRRIARQNGPALLFRNVKGHDIPLVTNLFGTESRILRALGADSIEEATERIDRAMNGGGSEGWLERLRFGGKGGAAASFAANRVKAGACQQVVHIGGDINLLELPLLRYSLDERSIGVNDQIITSAMYAKWVMPAIQSAAIYSAEPETHAQVILKGEILVAGRDIAVAVWSDVAEPSRLVEMYRKIGARMPVAIVVGGDPTVQLAAAVPLSPSVDPLGLAGLLREKPLDGVVCRSIDLIVPAESDIVIEGHLEPTDTHKTAGARLSTFGRMFFGRARHAMRVTAVTRRANPVSPVVVPDVDRNEAAIRDRFLARILLPCVRRRMPEVVDFDLPLSGNARHVAVVSIEKTYGRQARHVAMLCWGMCPFEFARLLIVVGSDVDVRDMEQVVAAISLEVNWTDDILNFDGLPDPLDATSPWSRSGRRIAIDATQAFHGEGMEPDAARVLPDENIKQLVTDRWAEYGLGPESES